MEFKVVVGFVALEIDGFNLLDNVYGLPFHALKPHYLYSQLIVRLDEIQASTYSYLFQATSIIYLDNLRIDSLNFDAYRKLIMWVTNGEEISAIVHPGYAMDFLEDLLDHRENKAIAAKYSSRPNYTEFEYDDDYSGFEY